MNVDSRIRQCADARTREFAHARTRGRADARTRGCTDARMRGCTDERMRGREHLRGFVGRSRGLLGNSRWSCEDSLGTLEEGSFVGS